MSHGAMGFPRCRVDPHRSFMKCGVLRSVPIPFSFYGGNEDGRGVGPLLKRFDCFAQGTDISSDARCQLGAPPLPRAGQFLDTLAGDSPDVSYADTPRPKSTGLAPLSDGLGRHAEQIACFGSRNLVQHIDKCLQGCGISASVAPRSPRSGTKLGKLLA